MNMASSNMAVDVKETMGGPMSSGKKRASDAYNYASDSAAQATKRTSERASDAKD